MPIYEFVCLDCRGEFERIQSFSDSSLPNCPTCQSTHVQRKLSSPAIHFKGSGWYITDSKNSSKQSSNGKTNEEAASKSDTEKSEAPVKAETKTEAKTETKTETKTESVKESSKPVKDTKE